MKQADWIGEERWRRYLAHDDRPLFGRIGDAWGEVFTTFAKTGEGGCVYFVALKVPEYAGFIIAQQSEVAELLLEFPGGGKWLEPRKEPA